MSMPRKIRCTVENLINHGGRVYTVDLVPAASVPPFRPGQFLHLTVDDYDPAGFWPESRVFSIASPPSDPKRIRICYSVKARYTTRMEQTLRTGADVWVKMPYGDFVINPANDAVLLAGGTGISAFTAFIEALQPGNPRNVCLVYGAREPALLLFRDMLLEQLRKVPSFHLLFFTETGNGEFTGEKAVLPKPPQCLIGRIDLEQVWSRADQPASSVFYLSGPPVMLATLSEQLLTRGVPADRIRTDAWE
jgi:ferredoxin-NADP reductase